MNLEQFLTQVVSALKKNDTRYALAGGLIASVYRAEKRLTADLDFLILADSDTQKMASKIISDFGLTPHPIRKADLVGGPLFAIKRKNTEVMMLVGRNNNNAEQIGLDFILPSMPWFADALKRAEHHHVNFGTGPVCCLTVEDVIVSKLMSVKNIATRFKDLDDLQSIFAAGHELDLSYIYAQMQKFDLKIPLELKKFSPKILLRIK
jgi:hypothetical protein